MSNNPFPCSSRGVLSGFTSQVMYCGKEEGIPHQHVHHDQTSRQCDYYLCSNCDPRVGKGTGATDADYGLRVRTYTITRYVYTLYYIKKS